MTLEGRLRIELLWFEGCPNHATAEAMLDSVLAEEHVEAAIDRVEVPDEAIGLAVCFPGSPTIRVNGVDIEPDWQPCEDCTPRCRIYATRSGLRGLPEREWISAAIRGARA